MSGSYDPDGPRRTRKVKQLSQPQVFQAGLSWPARVKTSCFYIMALECKCQAEWRQQPITRNQFPRPAQQTRHPPLTAVIISTLPMSSSSGTLAWHDRMSGTKTFRDNRAAVRWSATHARCFNTNNPRKKCPQILNSFYRMLGFLWDVRCYKSWGMQEQNRGIGFLLTAAARGRGVTTAGASLSEYQHTSTHHTLQTHLNTHHITHYNNKHDTPQDTSNPGSLPFTRDTFWTGLQRTPARDRDTKQEIRN